jgi:hypothetical protein
MHAVGHALELWLKMYVDRYRLLPTMRAQSLGHDAPRYARPTPGYVEAVVITFTRV